MSRPVEQSFEIVYDDEPTRVIRGRVTRPATATPAPVVMILHGFKGFMDWGFFPVLARRLVDAGFATVAFNTSGSGIGPGLLEFTEEDAFRRDTLTRQLEDIERVRAHVDGAGYGGVDCSRVGLFGHSRGGGAGLLHAAEREDYQAIVTWAAIDTVHRWDAATVEQWRELGHLPVVNSRTGQTLRIDVGALDDLQQNTARLDIEAACRRLTAPTLVCHGDADEAVSFEALDKLLAAIPVGLGQGLRVAGAGHTFGARHPLTEVPPDLARVFEATTEWFETHVT